MTQLENYIRDALASLMEMPAHAISVTEDLNEQGVDSLVGLRLARKIEEHTGAAIELEWLYDYPTIAGLAGFLEQRTHAPAPAALPT
jgi:aryl carrier-like protein